MAFNDSNPNRQSHHALPARPPPASYAAPPSRPGDSGTRYHASSSSFAGSMPRFVGAHATPQMPFVPEHYPKTSMSASYQSSTQPTSNTYNNFSHSGYAASASAPVPSYPSMPPMNRGFDSNYDPDEEAQIAEWNSAYNRDDSNARKGGNAIVSAPAAATSDATVIQLPEGKRKTVIREGGGKQWEDESLLEWNPLHPRLFIGNLAGEVTDDSLLKAFAKYPSLSKARVVRDKKSTKSRSYGFVSFSDTDDYFRAAKEMQGKYIGSHPVLIKRATSEVKAVTKRDDKQGKHGNHGRNNKNKNKGQGNNTTTVASAAFSAPNPVAFIPRGVQKKGKTSGPRVLG